MPASVKIDVGMEHWAKGAGIMPTAMVAGVTKEWGDAAAKTREYAQKIVHVVSGSLRSTGHEKVSLDGFAVVAEVAFGGATGQSMGVSPGPDKGNVVYAGFERGRGGSHDYLTPAFVANEDRFLRPLADVFENVVATWR